jgi:hypothetical protein
VNRRTLLATVVAVLTTPALAVLAAPAAATAAMPAAATAATPAAAPAAMAAAATAVTPTTATVRVEGLKRTLLPPKRVTTGSGWVTRYSAPKGACSDKTAQGALDVATKHRWGGTWDGNFGSYEVLSILGETHKFSSKYYWELFANNVSATVGACELDLRRGEQLLFAAVPQTGSAYPTAVRAPTDAVVGVPFKVKVVWFNAKGKAKPLANTHVTGSAVSTSTDGQGAATVTALHSGSLVLHAVHAWSARTAYVRAVPVTVHVS